MILDRLLAREVEPPAEVSAYIPGAFLTAIGSTGAWTPETRAIPKGALGASGSRM